MTLSPIHTASLDQIEKDKGISLRFPRCVTEVEQLKPEECSSSTVISEIYKSQMSKKVIFDFKKDDEENELWKFLIFYKK